MKKAIFWFRRDLRLEDNTALFHCLNDFDLVIPVFIFDKNILEKLPRSDRRVEFIWHCIQHVKNKLNDSGSDLIVIHDYPDQIIKLAKEHQVDAVYCTEDYEPDAISRDQFIGEELYKNNIQFRHFKDTVIFAKKEILNQQGLPYHVFTPYKNTWRAKLHVSNFNHYPSEDQLGKMAKLESSTLIKLEDLGFEKTGIADKKIVAANHAHELFAAFKADKVRQYKENRDFPGISGTSFLSTHFRFGTISIRKVVREILELSDVSEGRFREGCDTWLNEIIWRDFYFQIMFNDPHVVQSSFKPQYQHFPWLTDAELFKSWCQGQTGYPLVDAAMVQLNTLGYMHNRLRMLTASFLTKIMLIDYKMGEQYFAEKLLDYDLAANNGGWQWSASTGCDAQPYFRIFNPMTQSKKFDGEGLFIKKYLPIFADVPTKYLHAPWEYQKELHALGITLGKDYPRPVVDYAEARKSTLICFDEFLKNTPKSE
ncbi:MAG: deoxyribodipyrimidine photo-lyase [Candidatus Saccharibacteria bacterium]|nr:deoxyribodipyrimidine photo-lyase [Moraxellaceae bacterium]